MDINFLRQNEEVVKTNERNRYKSTEFVDSILLIDKQCSEYSHIIDNLNEVKNLCSKVISEKKEKNEPEGDISAITEQLEILELSKVQLMNYNVLQLSTLSKDVIDADIAANEAQLKMLEVERIQMIGKLANILRPNVIIDNNEGNNGVIKFDGDNTVKKPYSHIDLVDMIGGVDFDKRRSYYYLEGPCEELELAIEYFAKQYSMGLGYKGVRMPHLMNKNVMQEVGQSTQFDTELYKVVFEHNEDPNTDKDEKEKYLITTSEQRMLALFRNEWIPNADLPKKSVTCSMYFQQNVSSHGKDTRGLLRMPEFKKIELFALTSSVDEQSDRVFEELTYAAEEFYHQLGIAYRVVNIVSGALNNAAAIQYDLEGWFPGIGAYRKLASWSNYTNYYARNVLARYEEPKGQNSGVNFVHMLNCMLATTNWLICCILETYQTDNGIVVPTALQPHMSEEFRTFIPFSV